jgi:hypothetical protein
VLVVNLIWGFVFGVGVGLAVQPEYFLAEVELLHENHTGDNMLCCDAVCCLVKIPVHVNNCSE